MASSVINQLTVFAAVLAFIGGAAWNQSAFAQADREAGQIEAAASATAGDSQTERQRELTLRSVVRLDDHPLYLMKYYGGYGGAADDGTSSMPEQSEPWACSLFAALGSKDHPLFGRNFDWHDNPAVVLLTDSTDEYASVSMVDVSYLGYERVDKKFDTEKGRVDLLQAPMIPFDGMNEHGLTVGMAAVDGAELPRHPDVPTVSSLRIIRLILDQCRTVDEGLELFQKYNIDFSGGPQIHYLLADAEGHSALVELSEGKVNIVRNDVPWHAATNFYLCGNEDRANSLCRRYARIQSRLRSNQGILSDAEAFGLLKNVAQESTRWSVVYDLKATTAQIVMSRQYDHPIRISLAAEKPEE